jgi:UDP-glucuronate 4-epimerase
MILNGVSIPVFGDGSAARDYTYIDDIVAGVIAALRADHRYETINLGNSHPVSVTQMIQTLEAVLGAKASINKCPSQPGDVPITFADISKATRLLGYHPQTPFETGIQKFVAWLVAPRR